jgi:hypothetical protein
MSRQPAPLQLSNTRQLFRSAREIGAMAAPRPQWILPGVLAVGALTELVGPPKAAGKTTFALYGARAAIYGTEFLGAKTLQTPVVLLTEMGVQPLQEALRRADLLECDELRILSRWDIAARAWPAIVKMAEEEAVRIGSRMLVVDTLSQWAGLRGDAENNAGDALLAIEPLQRMAARAIGVMVVRHARKGGGSVGESARGSSAFTGAVDIVLSLTRPPGGKHRPNVRVLEGLSRFTETPENVVIEKVSEIPNPVGIGVWSESFVVLGDSEAVALDEARAALGTALRTCIERAQTADELSDLIRKPRATVLRALKVMADVRETGRGVKNDPKRYYRSDSDQSPISGEIGNPKPAFNFDGDAFPR